MQNDILDLCYGLPTRRLEAGERLLEFGRTGDCLFILIRGRLEISKSGVQIGIQDEPGAIYGEMSVLLDEPYTASVSALTPSEFYVIEHANNFLRTNQEITLLVTKLLARRLKNVSDRLVDIKGQVDDADGGSLSMIDKALDALMDQQDTE